MPPDSNLEQRKKNVWLKQLRYLLDIDSLIGLKSVFDRVPRKQETAHDSPLTGPHPSDHGWCSFIQQTLIKGFWWAWLMLLALPVQLYSWCSYRTRRQEKREAWVLEFVPVCLMSFLRRKKNPSKPVGEPRWRWFNWGSQWLRGGGMLLKEGHRGAPHDVHRSLTWLQGDSSEHWENSLAQLQRLCNCLMNSCEGDFWNGSWCFVRHWAMSGTLGVLCLTRSLQVLRKHDNNV